MEIPYGERLRIKVMISLQAVYLGFKFLSVILFGYIAFGRVVIIHHCFMDK